MPYHSTDPVLRPYPMVYPYFDLYPSKLPVVVSPQITELTHFAPTHTTFDNRTPPTSPFCAFFSRYADPMSYPHISLYPPVTGQVNLERLKAERKESFSRYPYLQICETLQSIVRSP